ncbi:hypothetical protein MUP77_10320, partial [Candidatus Bathyarchaeota archaeon]|nr:hypothetical protein [Candidatus Bathyarchaeota archaeon]
MRGKKKIPKSKALDLIDQKISQFEKILAEATYENRYNTAYDLTYYGAESLLTELFSKGEAMDFRTNVSSIHGPDETPEQELQNYKGHIDSCIAQLKVYRDRIQNFWGTDESKTVTESARARVVEEEKSVASEKKKSRLTLGNVISIIIVLVILTALYSPAVIPLIASSFKPEKVELSLIPYDPYYSYTREDLQKYGVQRTGITGYSANIYVSFEKTEVEIGEAIKLRVEIANAGNPLTKPYFYLFLVNNTGNVVSAFPEATSILTSNKLPAWSMTNTDGIDYLHPRTVGNTLSIPRQTLVTGQGDYWNSSVHKENCEIWLERQIAVDPSQIGRWELWVFAFDEQYHTSEGKDLASENAITYTTEFFDVIPETRPEPVSNFATLWLWLSRGASFGFVILSVFGLFKRLSPWIDSHSVQISGWWKNNGWIIVVSAILLI